jgi:hypothetical protein
LAREAAEQRVEEAQRQLLEIRAAHDERVANEVAKALESRDAQVQSELERLRKAAEQARLEGEQRLAEAELRLARAQEDLDQRVSQGVASAVKAQETQLNLAYKRIEELRRQLEEKPSHLRGGLQEEELLQLLRREFPQDRVERIKGRAGADIEQEVLHNGNSCGVILFESKNVQNWNWDFVDKLYKDKVSIGAAYAVLVSTAFPPKAKDLHVVEGIAIVGPDLMLGLVGIVRQSLVELRLQSLGNQDRGSKLEQLLTYFQSPEFKNKMQNVFRAIDELEELQMKERRSHDRVWDEQGSLHKAIKNSTSDVHSEITGVLAGR